MILILNLTGATFCIGIECQPGTYGVQGKENVINRIPVCAALMQGFHIQKSEAKFGFG